jgi:hypothetical protein
MRKVDRLLRRRWPPAEGAHLKRRLQVPLSYLSPKVRAAYKPSVDEDVHPIRADSQRAGTQIVDY